MLSMFVAFIIKKKSFIIAIDRVCSVNALVLCINIKLKYKYDKNALIQ